MSWRVSTPGSSSFSNSARRSSRGRLVSVFVSVFAMVMSLGVGLWGWWRGVVSDSVAELGERRFEAIGELGQIGDCFSAGAQAGVEPITVALHGDIECRTVKRNRTWIDRQDF